MTFINIYKEVLVNMYFNWRFFAESVLWSKVKCTFLLRLRAGSPWQNDFDPLIN